jgi:hypothetical protein
MVESSAAPARPTMAPSTFLELVSPQAVGLAECLIELEGPRGKMRIQWNGLTPRGPRSQQLLRRQTLGRVKIHPTAQTSMRDPGAQSNVHQSVGVEPKVKPEPRTEAAGEGARLPLICSGRLLQGANGERGWMAIDADNEASREDLIKVQRLLRDDGIEAALENPGAAGITGSSSSAR